MAQQLSQSAETDALLATAIRQHQAGRLSEAEQLYHKVLADAPRHLPALQYLAILALQTGRPELAVTVISRVLAENDRLPESHCNMALALRALDRVDEAIVHYRRALALKPDHLEAHNNLANALSSQCKWDEAVAHYQHALALKPDFAGAHNNLATALLAQGRPNDALIHCRRALALDPNIAEAHFNIANLLLGQGQLDQAAAHFERGLAINPNDPKARNSFGLALAAGGKFDKAAGQFERALALAPGFIDAYNNLAKAFLELTRLDAALGVLRRAIDVGPTLETKSLFIQCLRSLDSIPDTDDLRWLLVRAFSETWARAQDLGPIAAGFVKRDAAIRDWIARTTQAWPQRLPAQELLGPAGFAAISDCRLLISLIESTPVCDLALERLLTGVRHALLETASADAPSASVDDNVDDKILRLSYALARQCFLNEYIFDHTGEEFARARHLRDLLERASAAGTVIPDLWIALVAAYFPLHSVSLGGGVPAQRRSEAVEKLLLQQVREPEQERQLRSAIPALTAIADRVSVLVREQYEENPYPRWQNTRPPLRSFTVDQYLRTLFPAARFRGLGKATEVDVLIAGCGTGQQAIEAGQRLPASRVLAINLSLASLGYAMRKTRTLGLTHIEYAQADITELATIGRNFDVIESIGVLHHLADPFSGWRTLLSLLRPRGFMALGFYSELARAHVKAARDFIAERGYGSSAEEIRKCRQDLIDGEDGTPQKAATRAQDFFSMSECRDLLFHVQEHRLTLPQIAAFLAENRLELLGFELDARTRRKYRARFPGDHAENDLACWHIFEQENPDTFISMYMFWVQKAAPRSDG